MNSDKKIIVIGGGINGLCIAWKLAQQAFNVELYEADKVLAKTSSSSSKMLHGGIRYLEHFQFFAVQEALNDRAKWLAIAPQYVTVREFFVPVYKGASRPLWKMLAGVKIYQLLAGKKSFGKSRLILPNKKEVKKLGIKCDHLAGVITYFDAQMDEQALGQFVAEKASAAGVDIYENNPFQQVSVDGTAKNTAGNIVQADICINATGPWVRNLLDASKVTTKFDIEYVRGSHLVIDREWYHPFLLQAVADNRVIFALPYKGKMLLGTTEVIQSSPDNPKCSNEEASYLIDEFNAVFSNQISTSDIIETFSGVRPIVKTVTSKNSPSDTSREAAIETNDRLINVWGGKWTSALSLSDKVLALVCSKVVKNNGYDLLKLLRIKINGLGSNG